MPAGHEPGGLEEPLDTAQGSGSSRAVMCRGWEAGAVSHRGAKPCPVTGAKAGEPAGDGIQPGQGREREGPVGGSQEAGGPT